MLQCKTLVLFKRRGNLRFVDRIGPINVSHSSTQLEVQRAIDRHLFEEMSSGNLDGVLVPIERPEYENQGSMELGVMVGITLGIVLGIVGMVAYWCRLVYVSENAPEQRRGTNPRAVQAPFSSCLLHVMGQQGSIMPVETTEWMLEYRPSVPLDWHDLEAYRLDIALVERTTRLATGGFGSVWLGRFNQQQVAVKSMVEGRIRTLQHPNVVRFIGACWHSLDAVHLVVEYMNLGDLKDHLDIHVAMPWSRKVQCAHDVAAALVYLHDQNIIHRDLKSRNVLLDTHKPSKLSDFGISRELVSRTMSHEVGTFMWAAPEVLKGGQLTVAADIYSFGTLLVLCFQPKVWIFLCRFTKTIQSIVRIKILT
ncbi:hypothetical protein DYB37_007396 [Aphanomyces astaci]|uniref:Protein kinase domain-containing protein n=1 Tax=Aphanomyces astaci TaxID=112090 RepID=A0A418ELQ7_APHAT|nr:hypothetical protein DYB35_008488 [Aphanomyces astaci]RHZ15481.1 hypothetical protein DYB37_007396 [Aphanomyces astaci]